MCSILAFCCWTPISVVNITALCLFIQRCCSSKPWFNRSIMCVCAWCWEWVSLRDIGRFSCHGTAVRLLIIIIILSQPPLKCSPGALNVFHLQHRTRISHTRTAGGYNPLKNGRAWYHNYFIHYNIVFPICITVRDVL